MDIGGMIPPVYDKGDFPIEVIVEQDSRTKITPGCWHEDLEIKYIRSGTAVVLIDSQVVTARAGEVFFMNPYQIHSVPQVEGNDAIYDLIMIGLDFFVKSGDDSFDLRSLFMKNRIRFRNHIVNPRVSQVLRRLIEASQERKPYYELAVKGLILEFFALLLQEEVELTPALALDNDRIRCYRSIEPAVRRIHDGYNQKLPSEELAGLCSMSWYHFCRVFKKAMGVTPVQYQTEYRMRVADLLFQHGRQSIGEIAHTVGFEDEAYFSRCYKKYRGIAPKTAKANLSK